MEQQMVEQAWRNYANAKRAERAAYAAWCEADSETQAEVWAVWQAREAEMEKAANEADEVVSRYVGYCRSRDSAYRRA